LDIRYPARPGNVPDIRLAGYPALFRYPVPGRIPNMPFWISAIRQGQISSQICRQRKYIHRKIFPVALFIYFSYPAPIFFENWQYLNDLLLTEQFFLSKGQISGIRPLPDIQPDIWYPAF